MSEIKHQLYVFEDKTSDEVLLMNGFQHINQLIPYINELIQKTQQLKQENAKLKDEIEWYKQQCDDLEMQIGVMNNE